MQKHIDYINVHVIKKDQSHPTGTHLLLSPNIMSMIWSLNYQLIRQRFVHDSHQNIVLIENLGIYTVIPKSISKLSHPWCSCIISKGPRYLQNPKLSVENLDPDTRFHLDFRFLNKVSCKKSTSSLNIFDDITSHLFGFPNRSNFPPLQLIKTSIKFSHHHGYKNSIIWDVEVGEICR